MKIVNKIGFLVSAITTIIILCAGSVTYIQNRDAFKDSIYSRLAGTCEERRSHVETYLDMLQVSIAQLSKSIVLEHLLNTPRSDPGWANAFNDAAVRLKRTGKANPVIYEFLLINEKGLVVASSLEGSIGQDKSADALFVGGRKGSYLKDAYTFGKTKTPLIAVSTPISDSKTGKFLGVIAARVRLDRLDSIMTDRLGLGSSGETFIVNKYGYMITPSRFIDDSFLRIKVSRQKNYKMCKTSYDRSRGVGAIVLCQDYRGTMVLGTHSCISRLGWVLLTEIDEAEVFGPLRKMRTTFLFILVFAPIAAWALSFYIAKAITSPIYKLRIGTEKVSAGDLDYRVDITSQDEIGQLTGSFNNMTDDLQKKTVSIERLNEEVSRSKSLEYALRQSEIKYRTLYDSSADAVMLLAPGKKFLSGNPATLKLFGCRDGAEFIAQTPATLSPERQPDGQLSTVKAAQMMDMAMKDGSHFFEWTHRRIDGTEFPATVLLARVDLKNERFLQATVRDVSKEKKAAQDLINADRELREAHKELVEMEKLSALGRFSAGAAHEINNPLGIILGGVEFLQERLGRSDKDTADVVEKIKDATLRASRIIEALVIFSEPSEIVMKDILIDGIVKEAIGLISTKIKNRKINLKLEMERDLHIKADAGQLLHAVLNILVNAIEAIPESGEIVVRTFKRTPGDSQGKVGRCIVEIIDNGSGIAENDLAAIFEPFFTTKRDKGHVGLGLTMAKSLVNNNNGDIIITSEEGKGTVAMISLPLA